ncbi:hypothetical protein BU072_13115 [Mammaliicoccus vitulinus]|uniref:Tandem five-TM protein n=1 Tax=Mammaliicoccus vitulinus TaxID=71237 RepID=A0A2T4PQ78_9STAP|nr:DUF443 family protein [Mammaliicoccus vitulinus]PTI27393.1 hypothetical protein BU072_13115 [Mammaliicoccus vitulinus]
MLCKSITIFKNPKYRIIQDNDQYYIVNLTSNWLSYVIPMINWFIPKRCLQITKEEADNLELVDLSRENQKPVAFLSGGIAVFISALLRGFIENLDVDLGRLISIIICLLIFSSIICLHLYIQKKLTITKYKINQSNKKTILIPTLKSTIYLFSSFILFGFLSFGLLYGLIIDNNQNIFMFVCWGITFTVFTFLNMYSIIDKKVHVKFL